MCGLAHGLALLQTTAVHKSTQFKKIDFVQFVFFDNKVMLLQSDSIFLSCSISRVLLALVACSLLASSS